MVKMTKGPLEIISNCIVLLRKFVGLITVPNMTLATKVSLLLATISACRFSRLKPCRFQWYPAP